MKKVSRSGSLGLDAASGGCEWRQMHTTNLETKGIDKIAARPPIQERLETQMRNVSRHSEAPLLLSADKALCRTYVAEFSRK